MSKVKFESFGKYIRRLRTEKGLNQTELAAKIKLDSGSMSKVENDKKHLDEEKLTLLAKALNIDAEVMKKQYLSDQFAKESVKYKVEKSQEVYELAESKTKYYLNNNVKQGTLKI
ncbi:MAG: helix-turn-helix transcriptional regulator [Saprospiraceae bacterium]